MIEIVIIGGEGNGGVVASVIEEGNCMTNEELKVIGFLNDVEKGTIGGYPVLGGIQDWEQLGDDVKFVWAIHTIARNLSIHRARTKAGIPEDRFITIIHKDTFVAPTAEIGVGAFIMRGCYVGPRARIGNHSMLMANVNFGHDSECGQCCHFSVGAIVSSYVKMGDYSDVTLGARVIEKVNVGNFAVVGACALATRDVGDGEIVVGIPAKFTRYISDWRPVEE